MYIIYVYNLEGENTKVLIVFLFLGSKITAESDCSHEIRRGLILDKREMANINSVLKSRNITLLTKVCMVKAKSQWSGMVVRAGPEGRQSMEDLMPSNCDAWEDSWEPLGQQVDQTSQSSGRSTLNIHWKDWGWSWSSSILATWCKQMTHWKSPWCWERLRAEGEESVRAWDDWMASPLQWTWTFANSRRWWGTGKPGMLQSMGLQRVRIIGQLNNNNNKSYI